MKHKRLDSILRPFNRVTPPGAIPGTVVARPEEPKPVIRVMAFSNGDLVDKIVDSPDGLKELTETYNVTWINVNGLGDADVIHHLGDMFGLHRLALEDVVNVHQRAKVEDYGDHLFIVARMVDASEQLQTEQICFFVGQRFVLTFQEGKPADCLDPVRERIRDSSGRIGHRGTDYLAYALLDSIIDHYFPVVESYGERLDALDRQLIDTRGDASIAAINAFRSELLVLRRAIRPHREAINQLLRDTHALISDETRIFLRDCYDHTIQLGEAIDTYRDTCSDLRDFHLAAISNRTNDVMKTLTTIATIFIPLTFIAGLYGMNFDHMPELHWRYGYPVALGLMASVVIGLLLWFRRKGWFRG
ncbi:MAG: magnesium/cobalt transporter CorA [Planctomycetota bacterium]